MEVLLVDALARGRYGKRIVTVDAIGAGPRTVAGVLESKGIMVELVGAERVFDKPSMIRDYDALLVSAMSIDEPTVARLVKIWRRASKGAVIVGGPIASDPGFVKRVGADAGIHGESEPVLDRIVELGVLERFEPEKLSDQCGVVYVARDGQLVANRRCPIMPRRVWERYRPSTRVIKGYPLYWAARVYVETVRGCSNYTIPNMEGIIPDELLPSKPRPGCAYCSVISLWGYARSRSIDLVYEEVKRLIEEGVHRVVLSGPDFLDYGRDWLIEPRPLVDPSRPPPNLEAIRGLLERLSSIPEVSSGEASIMVENVKPNLVNEEVARILGEYLKGTPVHLGAEVGDDGLLERLGRPARVRDTLRAVKLLARHGLRPYIYVMYCLPGETRRVAEKTAALIEKLYRLGAEKVTAYKFSPLPLSYLEKLQGAQLECSHGHLVKEKAAEVNIRAKKRIVGITMRAIVTGIHPRYKRPVAYLLKHGPVLLLENEAPVGAVVDVRITGVVSDHLVAATVVRRIGIIREARAERTGETAFGRRLRRSGQSRRGRSRRRRG